MSLFKVLLTAGAIVFANIFSLKVLSESVSEFDWQFLGDDYD